MPDPDRSETTEEPAGRTDRPSTVRIEDFGDEVHLWVAQRVPWPVALEILRLLKLPEEASAGDEDKP